MERSRDVVVRLDGTQLETNSQAFLKDISSVVVLFLVERKVGRKSEGAKVATHEAAKHKPGDLLTAIATMTASSGLGCTQIGQHYEIRPPANLLGHAWCGAQLRSYNFILMTYVPSHAAQRLHRR